MTKKHFIDLADYLRSTKPVEASHLDSGDLFVVRLAKMEQWKDDVAAICRFCKSQNSAFMLGRFMDYINEQCGPSGGAIKKAS